MLIAFINGLQRVGHGTYGTEQPDGEIGNLDLGQFLLATANVTPPKVVAIATKLWKILYTLV